MSTLQRPAAGSRRLGILGFFSLDILVQLLWEIWIGLLLADFYHGRALHSAGGLICSTGKGRIGLGLGLDVPVRDVVLLRLSLDFGLLGMRSSLGLLHGRGLGSGGRIGCLALLSRWLGVLFVVVVIGGGGGEGGGRSAAALAAVSNAGGLEETLVSLATAKTIRRVCKVGS